MSTFSYEVRHLILLDRTASPSSNLSERRPLLYRTSKADLYSFYRNFPNLDFFLHKLNLPYVSKVKIRSSLLLITQQIQENEIIYILLIFVDLSTELYKHSPDLKLRNSDCVPVFLYYITIVHIHVTYRKHQSIKTIW